MNSRNCGACRGERNCPDCIFAGKTNAYQSVTDCLPVEIHEKVASGTLFLAGDIGTTTLAFCLADHTGKILSSYGSRNPQRSIAADVIGRVDASCHGRKTICTKMIKEALWKGFLFMFLSYPDEKMQKVSRISVGLAGNTVMEHILLSYPLEGLAKAPFLPYRVERERISFEKLFFEVPEYEQTPELLKKAEVTVFPCFSGFVGGDAAAGIQALHLTEQKKKNLLFADLGTNGEIILSKQGTLFATATAMGTAFEGGSFCYASDVFDRIARARKQGILSEEGLLSEPYFTEGYDSLTEGDVREFQLAKAAIRSGIELLVKKAELSLKQIDEVILSGGAGQRIYPEDLLTSGLLPYEFQGKIETVANTCLSGILTGLLSKNIPLEVHAEVLNLAEQPGFTSVFYQFMNFPEL